jgi:hypothetical protein
MILLSILIPSTPSRWDMTQRLYDKIMAEVGELNIEVLCFIDNHKRTIGQKRNDLKNLAHGKYMIQVDSDDDITGIKEIYEACKSNVDVITFDSLCRNSDGSTFVVTMGLGNGIEHNTKDGRYLDCKRPPFQMCAWNTQKFQRHNFPYISFGEDWKFIERCLPHAKEEIHIDKILHSYNFDPQITEAPAP